MKLNFFGYNFTYEDILFILIAFFLYFMTNFNIIEGKKGRNRKKHKNQKKKIKKLEKKQRKGNLSPEQLAKLNRLQNKVNERIDRRQRRQEQRRQRRERKRQERRRKKEEKRLRKLKDKSIDDDDIEMSMRLEKRLTALRLRKEQELYEERKNILNSMTTDNYWEMMFGNISDWKRKHLGKPGIEKQKTSSNNFNPASFFLKL
jgi:TolA-binding protein